MVLARNAFPAHLTPLERARLEHLIGRLATEPRLTRVVVFGSRARGRSRAHSDLDVAVYFSTPRDRHLERWLDKQAGQIAGDADELHLQIVPFFVHEPPSRIHAALKREGIVLWTRS